MKITIITAVYNREKTITNAIASVQSQSHRDIEHLVIDGASTDKTVAVISKLLDDRTHCFSEPDNGIYDALNKGIARASGAVIGMVHSDDFLAHEHVIARVAEAFADPEIEAVYGDLDYVASEDTSRIIRRWRPDHFSPARLRRGWMPPHPTLFVRQSVFDRLGVYDTRYRIAADYEAILRFFGPGGIKSAYIPEVLVKMRVGGESNGSLHRILHKSWEDYRALRASSIGGVSALLWKNLSKIEQFLPESKG